MTGCVFVLAQSAGLDTPHSETTWHAVVPLLAAYQGPSVLAFAAFSRAVRALLLPAPSRAGVLWACVVQGLDQYARDSNDVNQAHGDFSAVLGALAMPAFCAIEDTVFAQARSWWCGLLDTYLSLASVACGPAQSITAVCAALLAALNARKIDPDTTCAAVLALCADRCAVTWPQAACVADLRAVLVQALSCMLATAHWDPALDTWCTATDCVLRGADPALALGLLQDLAPLVSEQHAGHGPRHPPLLLCPASTH